MNIRLFTAATSLCLAALWFPCGISAQQPIPLQNQGPGAAPNAGHPEVEVVEIRREERCGPNSPAIGKIHSPAGQSHSRSGGFVCN